MTAHAIEVQSLSACVSRRYAVHISFGKVRSLEFEKAPLNSGGRVRIREDPARIRGRLNSARAVRIHPALRIRRRGLNSEGARIRGGTPRIRAMARIRMARAEFGGPRIQAPLPNSDLPLLNSDHPRPRIRPPPPNSEAPSNSGGGKPDSKGVEFRRSSRIQTPPRIRRAIPDFGRSHVFKCPSRSP